MKKTYKIIISILLIFITVLGFNFYKNNKIGVSKQNVLADETIDSDGIVLEEKLSPSNYAIGARVAVQKADENGDPQDNVTFKIKSLDGEQLYTLRRAKSQRKEAIFSIGNYYSDELDFISEREFYSYLTEEQREVFENIYSERDMQEYANNNYFCEEQPYYDGNGQITRYDHYCRVVYPTVYILEETKVPTGYGKKKVYIPGVIYSSYYKDYLPGETVSLDDDLYFENAGIEVISNGYYMEYGMVDPAELKSNDIEAVVNLWTSYGIYNNFCNQHPLADSEGPAIPYMNLQEMNFVMSVGPGVDSFYKKNCPIYIQNERGETKLEVSSYVNNTDTVTTEVNQVLDYKIVVTNTGNLDAVDNKVITKLPQGFIYVDGSVSDGGRYENGQVIWDIARINKGENLTLTYKAYAPKGANTFNSYIGETSVENSSIEGQRVEANKTYVKLSITNPYTYTPIGILVLILIVSVIALTGVIQYKAKQK